MERSTAAARRRPQSSVHYLLLILLAHHLLSSATGYEFRERPTNVSVQVGGTVLLRCSAPSSNTPFDTQSQWRTNTGALLSFHDAGVLPGHQGRYSYVKESPEELHLRIENVSLADDGKFECQMLRPPNKFMRAAAHVTVLVPPKELLFQQHPSGSTLEVNEDQPVNVTCFSSQAKPEPELSVYLNGKKIVGDPPLTRWSKYREDGTVTSFASLNWRPTKMDHKKMLSCEANHPETGVNLRNTLTLHVYYSSDRPQITLLLSDGNVAEPAEHLKAGQNTTLLCTAEGGNPPPTLSWSNQAGRFNATGEEEYDAALQITRLTNQLTLRGEDNEAVYECQSKNRENATAMKKAVTIHVDYPPSTVYLYGSTTVRKGESIVVACASAISSPPANITWLVDGKPTRMQQQSEKKQARGAVTESNITIDSESQLLSGQHQIQVECVAQNGEGKSVSNMHVIRVLSPPSPPVIFEPAERNFALLEGSLINLTCEAQGGHPLPVLSWYRGIEKIKETSSTNKGDVSESIVTVKLDRSMNQQHIRCEAENGALDVPLVATKQLTVLFPPAHVKIRPVDHNPQPMVADTLNKLICTVPSSNPPAEISWEFEGKTVGNDPELAVRSGHYTKKGQRPTGEYRGFEVENVLQFTPTLEMDRSQLRCLASHPQWMDVKVGSYTLDVLYPPRFASSGPMSVVVGEGESFEENLTIHSNPPVAQHQWRKNGISFERSIGSVYVRGPVLGGTFVTKDDSGIYTLKASNRIGTANMTLRVTVEYAARVTYITSPVIAGVGEDVVLECEGDGQPLRPQMIKWMKGDEELKSIVQDQRRAVLRLNASHATSGAYTCVADNGVGAANYTTAHLLVRRAPQILRSPALDRAAGPLNGKAHIRCRAMAVPNVEFSWGLEGDGLMINYNTSKYKFHDVQLDHSTFQSTLTVMDLEERDYMRRYRCRASNRLGVVQTFITLGPLSEPDIPLNLNILNVTDTTATLSWEPGFDGGSDQLFELHYQGASDVRAHSSNSSGTQLVLTNLARETLYRVQIRAANARGRVSDFTSALKFRTLDENMQGGGFQLGSAMDGYEGVLANPLYLAAIALFLVLLLAHLLLLCRFKRRQQRRKIQEKTELARSMHHHHNSSPDSTSTRPIQIYGSMNPVATHSLSGRSGGGGLLVGSPSTSRRQESMNASNRCSDLMLNESPGATAFCDDSQSVRTMIEVNPNGYMVNLHAPNFYDAHCLADYEAGVGLMVGPASGIELYSPIHKPSLGGGGGGGQSYASMHMAYPEPMPMPLDEKYPSLDQCPSPHLQRAIMNGHQAFTLPHDLAYGPIDSNGGSYLISPQHAQNSYQAYPVPVYHSTNSLGRGATQPAVSMHSNSNGNGYTATQYDSTLQRRRGSGQSQQSQQQGHHSTLGQQSPKMMSTFVQPATTNGHHQVGSQVAPNNGYGHGDDSVLVEGDLV